MSVSVVCTENHGIHNPSNFDTLLYVYSTTFEINKKYGTDYNKSYIGMGDTVWRKILP